MTASLPKPGAFRSHSIPQRIQRLHMVGIGGTGMCGIAEVLLHFGFQVSGSDLALGEATDRLVTLGARVREGHDAASVGDAQVLIISSAVSESNPEVQEARRRKIPVIRRAEMLGELMRLRWGIAVCGTHGKSTTTSMIGELLTQTGFDPTIIVGGRLTGSNTGARVGQGDILVAEASGSTYGVGFEVGYIVGRAPQTGQRAYVIYDARREHEVSRMLSGNTAAACVTLAYRSLGEVVAFIGRALAPATSG